MVDPELLVGPQPLVDPEPLVERELVVVDELLVLAVVDEMPLVVLVEREDDEVLEDGVVGDDVVVLFKGLLVLVHTPCALQLP